MTAGAAVLQGQVFVGKYCVVTYCALSAWCQAQGTTRRGSDLGLGPQTFRLANLAEPQFYSCGQCRVPVKGCSGTTLED